MFARLAIFCLVSVSLAAPLGACGGSGGPATAPPPPRATTEPAAGEPNPLADDAVAGVTDPALRALLADHWDWTLQRSPTWATTLGDHRNDDRLDDNSAEAREADRAARRAYLRRAEAIDAAALGTADRITLALFVQDLEAEIASEVCEMETWSVSARGNPIVRFNYLPERHKVTTVADGDNLLARYRAIPASIDNSIAALREGAAAGLFANAESVRRTVDMLEKQLAQPTAEWALVKPARADRDGWSSEELERFRRELERIVAEEIEPAYARYHALLAEEILPNARAGDTPVGLAGLGGVGAECYQARIGAYLGTPRMAEELHAIGLAEIERINDEMRELGKALFGTDDLGEVLARLRTDEELYFDSEEEIVAAAESALAAARAAIPAWFGILPEAECVVVPIPDYEAPYTTIAYYRGPHYDGSKPGEYFINTYEPETRPRFEMQVLSYHEAIPGHHLQIAINQELDALPASRKFSGNTAFVEGWALYTERLAEEMGLYSGDLDRMGMLSYDAWRASRLVVDTGIHQLGWSREEAEQFMLEHTALAPNNISNEVDRYISWPAQALAYKIGQLEILRLREKARSTLGDDFDIRAFHAAVLENGGVTLPVLADQIDRWISARGD